MKRNSSKTDTSCAAICLAMIFSTAAPARTAAAESNAPPAVATGLLPVPDYTGDLWHRSRLTGDWGGTRTDLANKGVQFDVDWTQYLQGVVDGGRDRTTQYGGHLDYLLHLDLMRMGVLPGALLTVRAESRYGNSVNRVAGPVLPVNTTAFFPFASKLDEDIGFTITDLNFAQFLSEHFGVFLGKLDTLDGDPNEFASGRGKSQFMHANFLFNSALALRLPYSTLGAGIIWLPTKNIVFKAGIINTLDSSTTTGFDDFGHGLSLNPELDVQYRLRELPGGMNIGGLWSFDQDFTEVGGQLIFQPGQGLAVTKKHSTWAIYWSGWQYLFVADPDDKPIDVMDGKPDHKGIGLFARAGFADEDTNPVEWSLSAGISGRGLIPTRDNDVYGVGYYYTSFQKGRFSGALGVQDRAQGMEAFYNLAITPAAQLTFDVQVQDAVQSNIDTAIILGVRLNLSF